LACLVGVG